MIVQGQSALSERIEVRILIHTQGSPTGAVQVCYNDRSALGNQTVITSIAWKEGTPITVLSAAGNLRTSVMQSSFG